MQLFKQYSIFVIIIFCVVIIGPNFNWIFLSDKEWKTKCFHPETKIGFLKSHKVSQATTWEWQIFFSPFSVPVQLFRIFCYVSPLNTNWLWHYQSMVNICLTHPLNEKNTWKKSFLGAIQKLFMMHFVSMLSGILRYKLGNTVL